MAMKWHIGCSGFHYKEWKEIFYPKGLAQAKWFSFYAQHFDTLEINNTFYRFPELKLFANWYQKSPAHYHFSVKVPQIITHYQQFKEMEQLLADFYAIAREGLKEKLGCILFQLPPKFNYSPERLESIIRQTNMFYTNVVEFRHISWWRKDVFAALSEHSISFCGVSYPGLISDAVTNSPVSYYRFHGVPKLYYSEYEESFLRRVIEQIANSSAETAYIYFNNTASAAALENARYVQELITRIDSR